jgi:hypothetical protein
VAPNGALVRMTVALGEPGSVPTLADESVPFLPSGLPQCAADLRVVSVTCTGLVPDTRYTLVRQRGDAVVDGHATAQGVMKLTGLPGAEPLEGGDLLTLRNSAGRALTRLHVAHLRVAIDGSQTVLASGTCQPGDYWGAPMTDPPASEAVGVPGSTGLGTVCPASGSAKGLSDTTIEQADDLSGGLTVTEVPLIEGEIPAQDATVYGPFRALAQTGVPGAHGAVEPAAASVAVTITPVGSKHVAWSNANVAVASGVAVSGLAKGVYDATWILRDRNGDTRTVQTTFVQAG